MPKIAAPLTDNRVKTERPSRGQVGWREVTDGGSRGLMLRISPRGEKVWAVRLTVNGRRAAYTLGAYPAVSLADARSRAAGYLAEAREGATPAETEARRSSAKKTVAETHAEYLEAQSRALKPRTIALKRKLFSGHIKPIAGRRLLRKIRRADVIEVVDAVRSKGLATQANRVFAEFMAMLRWAEQKDLIAGVPTFHKFKTRESTRDRTLTDGEISNLWRGVSELGDLTRDFVRLLLLTGQRRDEVRLMRWDELDLETGLWTIPASRYKTRRDHVVPLPEAALAIIRERLPDDPKAKGKPKGYVLAGREGEAFNGAASAMRRLRKALSGKVDYTLHDLRRTCRSRLSALGVDQATAELVIGHIPQGMIRVYDCHDRLTERKDALTRWANFVLTVAGEHGSNVIAMAKKP